MIGGWSQKNSLLNCQSSAEVSGLECRGLTLHRGRGQNEVAAVSFMVFKFVVVMGLSGGARLKSLKNEAF